MDCKSRLCISFCRRQTTSVFHGLPEHFPGHYLYIAAHLRLIAAVDQVRTNSLRFDQFSKMLQVFEERAA